MISISRHLRCLALGLLAFGKINQPLTNRIARAFDNPPRYVADRRLSAATELCEFDLAVATTDKVLNDFLEVHSGIVPLDRYLGKRFSDNRKP